MSRQPQTLPRHPKCSRRCLVPRRVLPARPPLPRPSPTDKEDEEFLDDLYAVVMDALDEKIDDLLSTPAIGPILVSWLIDADKKGLLPMALSTELRDALKLAPASATPAPVTEPITQNPNPTGEPTTDAPNPPHPTT